MFTKIKELCKLLARVPEERIVEEKHTNILVWVRRGANIDKEKLEQRGFVVIEGDSIIENTDFSIAKYNINITTKYSYNEGENDGEN